MNEAEVLERLQEAGNLLSDQRRLLELAQRTGDERVVGRAIEACDQAFERVDRLVAEFGGIPFGDWHEEDA